MTETQDENEALPEHSGEEVVQEERPLVDALRRIGSAKNHFDVLGVPSDASIDAFRNSYFDLVRLLHPDRLGVHDEAVGLAAAKAFERVREAWECLKDEASRTAYTDHAILGKKTEDELIMERVREIFDGEAAFRRGMAAFNAGRIIAAHAAFEEASRLVPEDLEFRMYLAYTTFRTLSARDPSQAKKGIEMIQRAIADGGRADTGHLLLGRIHREQGDDESAIAAFSDAVKANPANLDAPREIDRIKRRREAKAPVEQKKESLLVRVLRWGRKEPEAPTVQKKPEPPRRKP
jgi:tetratricopeptide (TPR) repeat protein